MYGSNAVADSLQGLKQNMDGGSFNERTKTAVKVMAGISSTRIMLHVVEIECND